MEKKIVTTVEAPKAIGPYSQAIVSGGMVFASGQLGLDPATGTLAEGVRAQADRALANLKAVLQAAGAGTIDVVKTTIFLTNMEDFAIVNEAYAAVFPTDHPARSTIQVAGLPKGGLVEIEAIAILR